MEIMEQRTTYRTATADRTASEKQAIEEAAQAELARCGYAALRRVCCEYREGVLTLRGTVASYYLKQIAQGVMHRRLDDMVVVNNRLKVISSRAD